MCPKCDRGQTYCAEHQFKLRRDEHVDAARERYANSFEGQKKTRSRKRRQRMREYCEVRGEPIPEWAEIKPFPRPPPPPPHRTSVTDTRSPTGGSPSKICPSVNQPVPPIEAGQRPREQRPEPARSFEPETRPCSFCGRLCGPFFRFEPKGRSPPTRPFRRGATAASE